MKKYGAEKLIKLFDNPEKEFEKYGFYKEIKELKKYCKLYGVEVTFRPYLARGFSYYNGTVFEIWSEELNASLAGGGSYLIGQSQSTGLAFGLEPISLLTKIEGDKTNVQIISVGQDEDAIRLSEKLRENKISVIVVLDKTPGKAMEYANSKGIEKVIFVGKEEVETKKFKIKDMKTGKESIVTESKLVGSFI